MALPEPVSRTLLHQRRVICRGCHRDDGLFAIEGHLEDSKAGTLRRSGRRVSSRRG